MTTTYDPKHPAYYQEADLRTELTRVFELCHGCRLCVSLCPSFPTLFGSIDAKDGDVPALSDAEQDKVVDECYQCKLCYVKCPYVPPHDWQLDFPRLMLRAQAVRLRQHPSLKEKLTTQALGRTDLLGRLGSAVAPVANAALRSPGSLARRAMEATVGIASERVLPPYARTRFSVWFKDRLRSGRSVPTLPEQARAAVFATCLVEYQRPDVGQDLVKVYERNGIACTAIGGAGCCGAPWLHAGHFDQFESQAKRNLGPLAQAVRAGYDIVVPEPTCGYVLKNDYVTYVGGKDAEMVSEHTYDASEYLWRLHRGEGTKLDLDFPGQVPSSIVYHVPCHLRAQNIGLRSRDLLKLTGAKVVLADKCSGIDGTWGLRSENYELARKVAQPLRDAINGSRAEVVAGDCALANTAIEQETGRRPQHPLQVLARAYGIEPEPGAPLKHGPDQPAPKLVGGQGAERSA
ncbi:MAG: heterodisulfide reductase-related iron-sulfur binding cluster [Actinobacteria bacterium]|nr:heterodisulfide reductase-related iron-sulfur binding cluster [Actinomycetota bacterium]